MNFSDFREKISNSLSPEKAYELYLQTQIALIQEVIISGKLITRDQLDILEDKVLEKISEKLKK